MYFANFLHIYQPSTQFPKVLDKITKESYREVISILKRNPEAKVTFNLASMLTELFAKHGYQSILKDFKELAFRGQIEFTSSAKYHPLLPKLPRSEIIRQIELNDETNHKYLGEAYQPRGFFPPEMAYSRKVASVLEHLGFEWVLVDESAYPTGKKVQTERRYKIKGLKLNVFFRETELSLAIAFSKVKTVTAFQRKLGKRRIKSNNYLITALDGETFGHHQPQQLRLFEGLCKLTDVGQVFVSDLLHLYKKEVAVEPLVSTWGTTIDDVKKGRIFPRWDNPKSVIHTMQWKLTRLAIATVTKASRDARLSSGWQRARKMLDKSLQSDQYWWASHNPCWHPAMVERGVKTLRNVVLNSPTASPYDREKARDLYKKIVTTGKERYGEEVIGC